MPQEPEVSTVYQDHDQNCPHCKYVGFVGFLLWILVNSECVYGSSGIGGSVGVHVRSPIEGSFVLKSCCPYFVCPS